MSQQLNLFQKSGTSTSLHSDFLVRIFQQLAREKALTEQEACCFMQQHKLSVKLGQHILSLRMSKDCSQTTTDGLLRKCCKKLATLGFMTASGNLLIQSGFYPRIENGSTLSDILEADPAPKYFLSQKTVSRILDYKDNTVTPLPQDTKTQSERMLLKVNSYKRRKGTLKDTE